MSYELLIFLLAYFSVGAFLAVDFFFSLDEKAGIKDFVIACLLFFLWGPIWLLAIVVSIMEKIFPRQ